MQDRPFPGYAGRQSILSFLFFPEVLRDKWEVLISHVGEVLSFLSIYVSAPRVRIAPRVAGLWIVMSTCYRRYVLWAAASTLPFPEIHATWQKIIAQSCRRALAWMYEAMWRASTRRLLTSCVSVSLLNIKAGCDCGVWSGGCGGVELWQPHTEAFSLCLSLNRGGTPPKKTKKNRHHQLLSPCPTPFPIMWIYRSHCVCIRH